jgi:hypothetical protein
VGKSINIQKKTETSPPPKKNVFTTKVTL